MRVVAALGGNALLRRGEQPTSEAQVRNVEIAAAALVPLAVSNELVITHGNGPQIGLLALQSAAIEGIEAYPLDILNAETDGMIGYLIERELRERLATKEVATLITMVVVDPADPAFLYPTKPIGMVYPAELEEELRRLHGWALVRDGRGVRRVVASPPPLEIPQLPAIRILLEAGVVVVCGGGGGIPVVLNELGWSGVEAVVDKDRMSAKMAAELGADALLLLTDAPAVLRGFGTDSVEEIRHATPSDFDLAEYDPGSIGPKLEAACWFAAETGGVAGIGRLADAQDILEGRAGTVIRR